MPNSFAKFRSGNFDVEDATRFQKPIEVEKNTIEALIDAKRRITTHLIAEGLNLSNFTIRGYLKTLGLISQLDICILH